ncbi:hypothetical protein P0136_00385 [Lentisphaerota bacterium ZTH]|nr:tetratricopeptide repeat protein [Lentisphaerota bacterium]WET06471.1 hypothetical protein P0136_00385 [Lentisphaerota bacterium ZTH]
MNFFDKEKLACVATNTVKPCLGAFLLLLAFFTFMKATCSGPAMVFFYVPFSFLCAILGGALLFPIWSEKFANRLMMPKYYMKTTPDQLSPIQGLIGNQHFDEAVELLEKILKKRPFCPAANLLLVEIYQDKLSQPKIALELIETYFRRRKVPPFSENVELLLRYSDLCLEFDRLDSAVLLLRCEAARKAYSTSDKRLINNRIKNLEYNLPK